MIRYKLILLSILGSSVLFAGCAPESGNQISSKPQPGMTVQKTSPGKPAAPISIEHAVNGVMAIGRTIKINLSITPRVSTPTLITKTSADGSLQIVTPEREKTYSNVSANTSISQMVEIVPQANGLFYLNVFVQIVVDGVPVSKVLAIPVEVGAKGQTPKMKSDGSVSTDEGGQRTISLPAKITVEPRK